VTYAVWIRVSARVVDGRTIYGIAKDIECQRGGRVEANVTRAPGRHDYPLFVTSWKTPPESVRRKYGDQRSIPQNDSNVRLHRD